MRLRCLSRLALCLILGVAPTLVAQPNVCAQPIADDLTIGAASSLTDVLKELNVEFEKTHPGTKVRVTLAASGVLKQQIINGAPIDLLLAASSQERIDLVKASRVSSGAWTPFISNKLVLAFAPGIDLHKWEDLTSPVVQRLVIADPASVPAGRYARQALTGLKLYDKLRPKMIFAQNVRAVLQYLQRGDAQAGVIFLTNLKPYKGYRGNVVFQPGLNGIVYEAVRITGAHANLADDYRKFLLTTPAQEVFKKFDFTPLKKS